MKVIVITLFFLGSFIICVAIAIGRYIEWKETRIITGEQVQEMRRRGLL